MFEKYFHIAVHLSQHLYVIIGDVVRKLELVVDNLILNLSLKYHVLDRSKETIYFIISFPVLPSQYFKKSQYSSQKIPRIPIFP